MYHRRVYIVIVAVLIFNGNDAKKSRKIKRPKTETEDSTPQPNVVSYSTFGFNDVGPYDGFVPSSPDYATYLSSFGNQESSTRLYAPAFPSALESTGLSNNFESPVQGGQAFGAGNEAGPQSSMSQYQSSSMNFFNTPSLDSGVQNQNIGTEDFYGRKKEENNAPVYGTKINSKNRNKPFDKYNITEFNVYSSGPTSPSDDKFPNFKDAQTVYDGKQIINGESSNNYQNVYSTQSTYPSTETEDFGKPPHTYSSGIIKYPKVIDFTDMKDLYPTSIDNEFSSSSNVSKGFNSFINNQGDNGYKSPKDYDNNFFNPTPALQSAFNFKNVDVKIVNTEKEASKSNQFTSQDYVQSYDYPPSKHLFRGSKPSSEYKDKFNYKPWTSENYTNNFNLNNPFKGYEYSTDHSNTSFKYDVSPPKKPFNINIDEIVPESSNIVDLTRIDLTNSRHTEKDYSRFKKIPGIKAHYDEDDNNVQPFTKPFKFNSDNDLDEFKSFYSTVPTSTTHWGNVFKGDEYSTYKQYVKKPQFDEEAQDEVVHIPKRQHGHKISSGKPFDSKPNEWPSLSNHRPVKSKKPISEWNKLVSNTRYKLEEDLLGLRNHDTSHPSYLPTYRPSSSIGTGDIDYKKVIDKWRQSYLKSKYKDALKYNDYESFPSEAKPIHVPIPKPYPIEVPHPVIVPVPQPYPVRVPIPKPVAVPVVQELTVPVEKPVPYAVIKKVPYPIEKPVPVPVEKEVPVPVVKPYPVPIPHVRPVFHHSKPPRDEFEANFDIDDDDYMPRPDNNKRIPFAKRPKSSRNRPRRPTRMSYYDRNRRRWPTRRPAGFNRDQKHSKPSSSSSPYSSYKYHDSDFDDVDQENSDYYRHCMRTGNC